jgi:hypothetical protein
MRDYIFKAKRLDNGKWVEGYGVLQYKEHNQAIIIHKQGNNLVQHTEVDPNTVCQYTGRTLKNGVKIFHKDRVLVKGMLNGKPLNYETTIEWNRFGFILDKNDTVYINSAALLGVIEVIGNIHD